MYKFNEQKERDLLMTVEGQLGTPKPGITRSMQQDFFNRLNVYKRACNSAMHFAEGFSKRQMSEYIDDVLTVYSEPVFKPFGVVELHKPDQTSFLTFNSKQYKTAVEYIKMLFTEPEYWNML